MYRASRLHLHIMAKFYILVFLKGMNVVNNYKKLQFHVSLNYLIYLYFSFFYQNIHIVLQYKK